MSSKNESVAPKSLNIGGKRIKVVVKGELEFEGGTAYGLYTPSKYLIELDKNTEHKEQVATLLHEAVHAALHVSGVGEMLSGPLEEAVCRAVELIAPNIYFKSKK